MGATVQTFALATSDLSLLAYAREMAETARSDDAKHMFEEYVELESRRLQRLASEKSPAVDSGSVPKGPSAGQRDGGQGAAEAIMAGSSG